MAERRPESPRSEISELLRMAFESMMLELCFSRPGIVQDFNARSATATIRPAPNLRIAAAGSTESVPMPPLVAVPLILTGGNGYGVRVAPAEGDLVMLLFSDRALARFKEARGPYDHDGTLALALPDAVALPLFPDPAPAGLPSTGLVIHGPGGEPLISLQEGTLSLGVGDDRITISDGVIRLDSRAVIVPNFRRS